MTRSVSGERFWYRARASPVRRLSLGSSSARSAYRAYCVQYLGPGSPVCVRVPRSTARLNAGVSKTGYGVGRAAGTAADGTGAGALAAGWVPDEHARIVADATAVTATRAVRPIRALRWFNRSRVVIPPIYRLRYVMRSPVLLSVNTRSSPLIDPVAEVPGLDWSIG